MVAQRQWLVAERLDFLYREAMQCFQRSKGMQTTIRKVESYGKAPLTVTTTRSSAGDVRYLQTAARLSLMSVRLPLSTMPDGMEEVAKSRSAAAASAAPTAESPSREDYSAEFQQRLTKVLSDLRETGVSTLPNGDLLTCDESANSLEPADSAPVQAPSARRPLSRRDRRARRSLLAKAKAKSV